LTPFFGGCVSVGPDYEEPEQPAIGTATSNSLSTVEWWKQFNDPALDHLVTEALQNNKDLKSAFARVREARAQLGMARGRFGPEVDLNGSATRYKASENAYSFAGGKPQSLYSAGFDALWEIDLFGGTRRSVEAAVADWQAQQANLGDVQISVAAETAGAYLDLLTYQRVLAVAKSSLAAQQDTLDLLTSRYAAGLSNELAVQQARYNLESTRASVPPIEASIEASRNALAVLVGQMPGRVDFATNGIVSFVEVELNGIPADVLRRRPDVRRAERQLASATARIGQSTAELYPKFNLVGSIGLESLKASTLLEADSQRWSIAPGVSWPIFHMGAIRNNIHVQEARQEQALAAYETAVLNAVREVRNALVDYRTERERRETLARAVSAAQTSEAVANDLYKNGVTDFNNVLDAQRSLYILQRELAVSEGRIASNTIRLFKALGGGWEPMESTNGER
jgi:NodT family efflux transporter outer membrane factor (OMF) lipoprotein